MPAAADKKRKKADSGKASPVKKRKLDASPKKPQKKGDKTPKKSTPAKTKKVVPASKVKKSTPKSAKAKSTDKGKKSKPVVKKTEKETTASKKKSVPIKKTLNSKAVKKTTATKPSSKPKPSPKKVVKKTPPAKPKQVNTLKKKQTEISKDKAKKNLPIKTKQLAVKTLTRVRVETEKAKQAKATVAKAKLKAVKSLNKAKQQANKKPVAKPKEVKKPQPKQKQEKAKPKAGGKSKEDEKKPVSTNTNQSKKVEEKKPVKPAAANTKQPEQKLQEKPVNKTSAAESKKRKNTSGPEATEAPRKKRVITPNKRYADFETDTSPKRISELRAFVQDKKKTTPTVTSPEKPLKISTVTTKQESTPVKRVIKESPKKDEIKLSPQIKVIKTSEMKPAEKLLKKLQRKLEKEAKAAFAKPKQSPNKDSVKTKITKVVTYNKPTDIKSATKNLSPKAKTKPAVVVKKKAANNTDKTPKVTPKTVQTPKKVKEQKREDRKIQAKFVFQKNVRQADDASTTCWVTGIDVFKSGEIVFIDMANKKIKLFSSAFEYMSQAKLDTTPQDISISPLDASVAYFTKPFSKEGIQKICLSDGTLTVKDSFLTNGTNRGIKCIKSGILTSVQNGRYHDLDINCFKIELLDYKGNMIQSVSMDQNGTRLFKLPLYFTVNNTGKQIVVSDCIRNNSYILSLDMSGKIKFKYTGVRDNLITPRGLTTDDENNIYVTEWERHHVYVLTPAGKRLQLLLDHTEQLKEGQDGLKKPYQLCFYKHEGAGRLIVSQESCNTIKVFQINQKQPEQNGATEAAANGKPEKAANTTPSRGKMPEIVEASAKSSKNNTEQAVEESKLKTDTVTEEIPVLKEPVVPAVGQTETAINSTVPVAASILSQEHAYTTLAAPAEKQTETDTKTLDPPSDPAEEHPEELSSLVDSIISDLNNRDTQGVEPIEETVVQDDSF